MKGTYTLKMHYWCDYAVFDYKKNDWLAADNIFQGYKVTTIKYEHHTKITWLRQMQHLFIS